MPKVWGLSANYWAGNLCKPKQLMHDGVVFTLDWAKLVGFCSGLTTGFAQFISRLIGRFFVCLGGLMLNFHSSYYSKNSSI